MFPHNTLAHLLLRLRGQSALYVFGSGASAPVAPFAPALMLRTASDYIHLGSFPSEPAAETILTARIKRMAEGFDFYPERPRFPGTPEFPTDEVLMRLPHCGALATYVHQLSIPRFARRRITNYTVLRAFHPSLMLNFNLDGLASDTCGWRHWVEDVHGSAAAGYGGPAGAEIARVAQEYGIEIRHDDLWPCGPESAIDQRLNRKLQTMLLSNPAFVMIVGYSFAKTETGNYDDQVSLDAFVRKFRGTPIDVYVLDPRPYELAEMLSERLQSERVHAFSVYWNVLTWAFTLALSGRLDVAALGYFHEKTLDDLGPGVAFPRER